MTHSLSFTVPKVNNKACNEDWVFSASQHPARQLCPLYSKIEAPLGGSGVGKTNLPLLSLFNYTKDFYYLNELPASLP